MAPIKFRKFIRQNPHQSGLQIAHPSLQVMRGLRTENEEGIIGGHLRGYLSQGFKSGRRQDKVRMHSFYQGVCRKCQTRDLKQRGHQKKEELAFSWGILERPSRWWSQVRWTLSD